MSHLSPEEVIRKIAVFAAALAQQAGTGGMETAGLLVSGLATHPEKIAAFLSGELSVVDDDYLMRPEFGCLTWHARNGKIIGPAQRRAMNDQPDN